MKWSVSLLATGDLQDNQSLEGHDAAERMQKEQKSLGLLTANM